MLYYALVFLIVGLIAGALGLAGVAAVASQIAWVLFLIGVVLLVVHLVRGRTHDDYREDLLKLIEGKIKSGQTHAIEEPEGETEPKRQAKVVNIMDLLKRSLEKAERGEGRLRRKAQTRPKAG